MAGERERELGGVVAREGSLHETDGAILMNTQCQRCGVESPDLRTLLLNCLWKLEETGIPFTVYDHIASDGRKFYALRICKECRGLFIRTLMRWFGQENWADGAKL